MDLKDELIKLTSWQEGLLEDSEAYQEIEQRKAEIWRALGR